MAREKKGKKTPAPRAEPLSLTQREVDAMKKGGKEAAAVVRRLRSDVPSGPVGKPKSKKLLPVHITRKEMAEIRRTGKVSATIRSRQEKAAAKDPARISRLVRKMAPSKDP